MSCKLFLRLFFYYFFFYKLSFPTNSFFVGVSQCGLKIGIVKREELVSISARIASATDVLGHVLGLLFNTALSLFSLVD